MLRWADPSTFSDYIVYVDESGDHGLTTMEASYPVFVLAFCIFEKETYIQQVVPALQRFKLKYFGHDLVVLHEREMRKKTGAFKILNNRQVADDFMADINQIIEQAKFTVLAAVIHKAKLQSQYTSPTTPTTLPSGSAWSG